MSAPNRTGSLHGLLLPLAEAGVSMTPLESRPARHTLWVALGLAVVSAALPQLLGNVLPWAVVQFGGLALIAWAALQRPAVGAIGVRLGALIGWYALAKVLELGDEAVFHATGEVVSGHSLKHIAAALAAWPVLAALRQNAAGSGVDRA